MARSFRGIDEDYAEIVSSILKVRSPQQDSTLTLKNINDMLDMIASENRKSKFAVFIIVLNLF